MTRADWVAEFERRSGKRLDSVWFAHHVGKDHLVYVTWIIHRNGLPRSERTKALDRATRHLYSRRHLEAAIAAVEKGAE